MNVVNRVVVVVEVIVLMIVLTLTAILPHVVLIGAGRWLGWHGARLLASPMPWVRFGVGLLIAVVINCIGALLLGLELWPKSKRHIRVQQATGGIVILSNESVVQQLQYRLEPLPGVLRVKPSIQARQNKVQAVVAVDVAAGVNVPEMARQLLDIVQTVLTQELGLQVYGKPTVQIKVAPQPAGARPSAGTPHAETNIPVPALPAAPEVLPVWAGRNPEDQLQEPRA